MEIRATNQTFKSYLFFWGGQLISLLGSSIIHFVVIWWIKEVTPDINDASFLLGLANFFGMLPLIVLSPIAGVFIDRWNRKYIIAIADFMQALITFWLIMIFILGTEKVILVILINSLRGVCQAFHFPTVKAVIPIMIPKDKLSRMNAIDYGFNGLIQIAGPAVGAFFYELFPIANILWIDIITFIIAIIPLILIKIPKINQNFAKDQKKNTSFFKDFSQGIRGLKQVPGLVILLILISIINFLGVPFGTLLPIFVGDIHKGDAFAYAFVVGLMQLGMIIGSIIATVKKDFKNRVLVIMSCILISIVGFLMSTLSPIGNFAIIGIGGMIRAATVPLINTNFLTIIQLHVPPEKQGKVMSIVVSLAWAVIPPGSLIAGSLAALIGIVPLYLSCIILNLITVVMILSFTKIRSVKYESLYDTKKSSIKNEAELM